MAEPSPRVAYIYKYQPGSPLELRYTNVPIIGIKQSAPDNVPYYLIPYVTVTTEIALGKGIGSLRRIDGHKPDDFQLPNPYTEWGTWFAQDQAGNDYMLVHKFYGQGPSFRLGVDPLADATKTAISINPITGDDAVTPTEAAAGLAVSGTDTGVDGQTIRVQFFTDQPGQIGGPIEIFDPLTTIAHAGKWSVTLPSAQGELLPHGTTHVEASALGINNQIGATAGHTFLIDQAAPLPKTITFNPVAGDNIIDAQELAAGALFSGTETGIDGTPLSLSIRKLGNDQQFSTILPLTAGNGSWSFTLPASIHLTDGDYFVRLGSELPPIDQTFKVATASPPPPEDVKALFIEHITDDDHLTNAEQAAGFDITGTENKLPAGADIEVGIHGLVHPQTEPSTLWQGATTAGSDGKWSIHVPFPQSDIPSDNFIARSVFAFAVDSHGIIIAEAVEKPFTAEASPPPPPPPPPPEPDMAVNTYDETKTELRDLLLDKGVSPEIADFVSSHVTYKDYHDGEGRIVPVEVKTEPGGPVPIVPDAHGAKPQVLVLEANGNPVDENLDPSLRFIVDVKDDDSILNITGAKAGIGVYSSGDGSDTITSSSSGAHETLQAGDANATKLVGGSGAADLLRVGNGNNDTLVLGSGAGDSLIAGDGDHDSLQAGSGAHQLLKVGDGDFATLVGGTGAYDTLTAGHGQHDSLQAGSGLHQLLKAGDGDFDTLVAGTGGDTLDAGGDNTLFKIAHTGNDTVITHGGLGDTISFEHDNLHVSINENDKTDTVTVKFSDTGQSVKIVGDDQGITLHFTAGPDVHLT